MADEKRIAGGADDLGGAAHVGAIGRRATGGIAAEPVVGPDLGLVEGCALDVERQPDMGRAGDIGGVKESAFLICELDESRQVVRRIDSGGELSLP